MNARIVKVIGSNYYLYDNDSCQEIVAKPLGIFRHQKKLMKPIVGDLVEYVVKNKQCVITNVFERKNKINRPKIANVDYIFVVVSWVQPEFNSLQLDKYLAYYEYYCQNIAIIFTKSDLIDLSKNNIDFQKSLKIINDYKQNNYVVFDSNCETDLKAIRNLFDNKVFCLVGNSGVGKSTLINKLNPNFNLKTQEISKHLNRGKHTTTTTQILPFLSGFLVDTPGFATLDIDFNSLELSRSYHDFFINYTKCMFDNCLHTPNSKNCEIVKLVNKNKISLNRYKNYLSILEELKYKK